MNASTPIKGPNPAKKILKPALKKRSVSDYLRRPPPKTTRVLLVDQPKRTSELSLTDQNNRVNAVSPEVLATHRQPKLRFNSYVEQCIALSDNEEDDELNTTDAPGETINSPHQEGLYEDDDVLVLNVTKRSSSTPSIMKIEPTRLKRQAPGDFGVDSDTSSVGSYDLRLNKQQPIEWIGQSGTVEYDAANEGRSRDMDDDLIQNYDWAAWDLGAADSDEEEEQDNDYQYRDINYQQDHFDDEDDMEPPTLFFNEPNSTIEEGDAAERLRTLAYQMGNQPKPSESATVVGNVVQWAKLYIFGSNPSSSS